MIARVARCVAAAGALVAFSTVSPAQSAPAIAANNVRARLFQFADDSMLGRATGTRSLAKATDFIARELEHMPVKRAGDGNSFFQKVPISVVKVDYGHSVLASLGFSLVPGVDFVPLVGHFGVPFGRDGYAPSQPVAPRGALGAVPDMREGAPPSSQSAHNPADVAEVSGRVVLLEPPLRIDGSADYQVWNAVPLIAQYRYASAILIESLDVTPRSVLAELSTPGFALDGNANPAPGQKRLPSFPPVFAVSRSAASLIRSHAGSVTLNSITSGLGAPARNVVAMVEGSDPQLKSEIVVVSAHADHLGVAKADDRDGADSIMNGADASGSGSVALLAIAEHISALSQRPKRTVVFLWTVGTEQGMLGAQWFIQRAPGWLGTIVADINLDAIGRGAAADIAGGGPDYVELHGAAQLSVDFGQWIDTLVRAPRFGLQPAPTARESHSAPQNPCIGNQVAFAQAGVPSVLITTGMHPDVRTVRDAPPTIDYDKLAKVARFAAALALDVADRPSRPVVDDPVRGPLAVCRR